MLQSDVKSCVHVSNENKRFKTKKQFKYAHFQEKLFQEVEIHLAYFWPCYKRSN